jgi:acetyl esterase/lipase
MGNEVIRDLAYAPPEPAGSQGHLLDVYFPEPTGQPVLLVLWSHGSGWLRENGREGAEVVAARLNPLGIAVAGVAIRSSTSAQFPGQLHDAEAAIRFLKNHAWRYGLDPDRFATTGESSGGWAAVMAAVTGNVPELEGEVGVTGPSSRVAAAVAFYPPTDFLQMDAHMIDCPSFNSSFELTDCHNDTRSPESLLLDCPIRTCPDKVAQANPITYVDPQAPPMLILHGTNDRVVPHHQSELLREALQVANVDVTFISVPGGEHGAWDQWLDGRANPDRWDAVITFLQRTIGA